MESRYGNKSSPHNYLQRYPATSGHPQPSQWHHYSSQVDANRSPAARRSQSAKLPRKKNKELVPPHSFRLESVRLLRHMHCMSGLSYYVCSLRFNDFLCMASFWYGDAADDTVMLPVIRWCCRFKHFLLSWARIGVHHYQDFNPGSHSCRPGALPPSYPVIGHQLIIISQIHEFTSEEKNIPVFKSSLMSGGYWFKHLLVIFSPVWHLHCSDDAAR